MPYVMVMIFFGFDFGNGNRFIFLKVNTKPVLNTGLQFEKL